MRLWPTPPCLASASLPRPRRLTCVELSQAVSAVAQDKGLPVTELPLMAVRQELEARLGVLALERVGHGSSRSTS